MGITVSRGAPGFTTLIHDALTGSERLYTKLRISLHPRAHMKTMEHASLGYRGAFHPLREDPHLEGVGSS